MKIIKNRKDRLIPVAPIIALVILLVFTADGFGQTQPQKNIAGQAEKHVEKAIQIQQTSYKDKAKWEHEKSALVLEYENMVQQKLSLENENKTLAAHQKSLETLNKSLVQQKNESIRIANELIPFLNMVYARLETFIENDSPFLKKERSVRLTTLSRVLEDPEITFSEKYRKVMEALFIEAEYGTTIEVYQDKVMMAQEAEEEILGNIFRLGRVSLFFLSLDEAICGAYNPDTQQWQILSDTMLPAICSAVQIGSKQRPAELLSLPIGRLVQQGGDL